MPKPKKSLLKFSLVIALAPTRNAEVLASLDNLNYDKRGFELIIEKGLNPSENRNRGASKAKGEIIAFIDDDAVVDKDILKNAESFFSSHPEISIIGGPQLTPQDDKGFAKISGYALSSRFGAWKMANRYSGKKEVINADETMLTSANMFCRKEVLKKIQFDTRLFPGEDPDFINKAQKIGFKIAYTPTIRVYHRRRPSFKTMIKQIYTYGKTRPEKESLRESLKHPFFIVPSVFLIYLVFLGILVLNWIILGTLGININSATFLLAIPLFTYLIINLILSVAISIKNLSLFSIILLPIIFLAIHLSYGYGFLISTIKNERKNAQT